MNHVKNTKRIYAVFAVPHLDLVYFSGLVTDDPLTMVSNLSGFIFFLIQTIGLILLGFGILQIGLALKSHAASQRSNGMLALAGGIVSTFTKEILSLMLRDKKRSLLHYLFCSKPV